MCQAKLTERGMLRPSFVPPAEIRELRDYTRLRSNLTRERSRHAPRVEKLLEDALIKLSSVATNIMGVSGRAMIGALIGGERDPEVLASLARGRMKVKHAALVLALTGRFDEHHAELARILLGQYDALTVQIDARRSDGLLLTTSGITSVPLPRLSQDSLLQSARPQTALHHRSDDVRPTTPRAGQGRCTTRPRSPPSSTATCTGR